MYRHALLHLYCYSILSIVIFCDFVYRMSYFPWTPLTMANSPWGNRGPCAPPPPPPMILREWYHFVQGTLRNHISDVIRKKLGLTTNFIEISNISEITSWSSVLLLFHHLCHNIVSNMLQSYLFCLYWKRHTWKLRFRHQNHFLIATRTEVMKHLPK